MTLDRTREALDSTVVTQIASCKASYFLQHRLGDSKDGLHYSRFPKLPPQIDEDAHHAGASLVDGDSPAETQLLWRLEYLNSEISEFKEWVDTFYNAVKGDQHQLRSRCDAVWDAQRKLWTAQRNLEAKLEKTNHSSGVQRRARVSRASFSLPPTQSPYHSDRRFFVEGAVASLNVWNRLKREAIVLLIVFVIGISPWLDVFPNALLLSKPKRFPLPETQDPPARYVDSFEWPVAEFHEGAFIIDDIQ